MKTYLIFLVILSMVLFTSCATKFPTPKNPDKGIVAISVEASNRSDIGFYRYLTIYPQLHPEYEIIVYPKTGKSFVFSPEMVAGKYNFNRVKNIPWNRTTGSMGYKSSEQNLYNGIHLNVVPGAVTILDQKLMVKQIPYEASLSGGDKAYSMDVELTKVLSFEMRELIEEFKRIDTTGQWKIANEL